MDTNDLRAKIEALPVHEMDTMQGVIDVVDREAVLVLVATHAAEPAPVAVEPFRVMMNDEGRFSVLSREAAKTFRRDFETEDDAWIWLAKNPPRADLAPTGNTALVEALREIHNMGQSAEPDHWKFRCHARDVARAALASRPAEATSREGENHGY